MILKIKYSAILFVIAVCLLSGTVLYSQTPGQDEAEITDLFNKMVEARSSVSYWGKMNIERLIDGTGRHFEKEVYVNPVKNRYRERIVLGPELEARIEEIRERIRRDFRRGMSIRQRRMMQQYNRDMQRTAPGSGSNFTSPLRIDKLRENYTLIRGIDETIAGRSADGIAIRPDYDYRPGNKIWIDVETGVILKREIFNPKEPNKPVYREVFIEIHFVDPDAPFDVTAGESTERYMMRPQMNRQRRDRPLPVEYPALQDLPDEHRTAIHIPGSLPQGFVLDKVTLISRKQSNIYHQIYTDGLMMFSLFQVQGDLSGQFRNETGSRQSPQPLFAPRGTVLIKRDDGTNFILMGYAPAVMLQSVFDSLQGEQER